MDAESRIDGRGDDPAVVAEAGVLRPRRRWQPGTALAVALLLVAALALSVLSARGEPFGWDAPVVRWVQASPGWTVPLAEVFSWVGLFVPSFVLALLTAGWLWRLGARWPAGLVILASLLHGLNPPMKAAVGRARPGDDLATVIERAQGLGFPSGHAFGAMVLFPVLAAALGVLLRPGWGRWLAQAALLALAVGIGWSRVRLGAHWPSDVLGGWLWGGAIALVLIGGFRWVPPLGARWPRRADPASGAER
jgi:membrane-associated phospholipid phosphatase